MEKDKLIKMLIGFLPLLLLFLDPPEGMDPKAWGLFPFYAGAILMVMLRPVGEATALAIFLGLYAVMMRGHTVALSGFALTMTWLVVGAYIIAQAFRDTNLGKRISFWMIRIFGRSTLGLGYAAAFADFISGGAGAGAGVRPTRSEGDDPGSQHAVLPRRPSYRRSRHGRIPHGGHRGEGTHPGQPGRVYQW